MSILTWNCQGAFDKRFPSIFNSFVENYRPDVFVVMEPRISGNKADQVIRRLRYSNSHRIEAQGFSGGIWILWSDRVRVKILHNHYQFIHTHIEFIDAPAAFLFSAIYGNPQASLRRLLWQDISLLAPADNSPWLLAGDFNATSCYGERSGSRSRLSHGCPAFKSFISQHGLIDLGFHGPKFTWRRGLTLAANRRCNHCSASAPSLVDRSHFRDVTHMNPLICSRVLRARLVCLQGDVRLVKTWERALELVDVGGWTLSAVVNNAGWSIIIS